jgi:predicted Ser/Thr protein kinase
VNVPNPLRAEYEDELHLALIEGVVTRDQLEPLREEARRLERSPLQLLLERGQLSPETVSSLRGEAQRQAKAAAEEPPTQQPGAAKPSASTEPTFPLPGWDRYQPVRFLGQGGMGQVFLAYDPRLRRNVALKFVRDGAPELAQRFLSEARAQARVQHERVCEMYEVGEVQGRAYIAMQYVEGKHLGQLASELTLEQKLLVLRDVAEGVHAAHRAGLIHRDLKPSNILVERTEDGRLKPYVMDFGLARDWHHGDNTATGAVLGTPHYMAPEQARGEVSRLDRRVDVYSLGATLYQVLVGQPPFLGVNALEVVNRIQSEEPRSPRALDPELPVDLEAIVLKCLEKDRSARYDSARALAEDLERFLSGEPVLARAAGALYRLRKKARKHRIAVAVGSVALTVVVVALGQVALARREVTLRERLSRRFTELVERIEAMARYSAMAPLHDTRGDREAIRARMGELETEVRQGGTRAEGPGSYAVGRALMALGDAEGARAHLESAWQRGYREARVAYALALVLGQLYQEQLLEVERIRNADQRAARRRQIERDYRDPALGYLRQSEGAEELSPEYVAALLAFYEGRYDEALSGLESMRATNPWFYEAPLLRGDILVARAMGRKDQGDRTGALADLEAARKAQAQAADIGESLPVVYYAMARLEHATLLLELYGQGEIEPAYQRGLEALSRALTAAPDHFKSRVVESRLHRRMAEQRISQGGEALPLLEKALATTRAAQAQAPDHPMVQLELVQVLRQWARYRQERNEDPNEQLRQSIEALERMGLKDRDYAFHLERGLIFKVWADAEDQRGGDSLPHRGQAIDAYLAAIQLEPGYADAYINLGTAYFKRATHAKASNAEGDLQKALDVFGRARGIDPGNFVTYFYEGQVYERRALRRANRGESAEPDLAQAVELYRKGQAINGKLAQFPTALGTVLMMKAELVWDEGGDAFPLLDQAQAAFEQARELAPQQAYSYSNLGQVNSFRALFLQKKRADPVPSARAAAGFYRQALERVPRDAYFWTYLARTHHLQAAWAVELGKDPTTNLEQASQALRQALTLNPRLGAALRYQGETLATRARWLARRGQANGKDFEAAAQAFQQALAITTEWKEYHLGLSLLQRDWAKWLAQAGGDPSPLLQQSLEMVDEALAPRPQWAYARAVRASVLLTMAETTALAAQRQAWASEGRRELEQALASNANLVPEWGTPLASR